MPDTDVDATTATADRSVIRSPHPDVEIPDVSLYDFLFASLDDGDRDEAAGIARARDALSPGGLLAVWSAAPDPKFTRRLKDAGLEVEERTVRARPNNKGPRHTIWFAKKP